MENSLIGAVKIVHDEMCGGEYRLLADFFRLVGSYVCNCELKPEEGSASFDVVILIKKNLGEQIVRSFQEKYETVIELDPIESMNDNQVKKSYLAKCLSEIYDRKKQKWDNTVALEKEMEILKSISELYVEYGLMQARCSGYYLFAYEDIVREAQQQYVDAYVAMIDMHDTIIGEGVSKYFSFAKLNIAKWLNETCYFLNQSFLLDTKKMMDGAEKLRGEDPSFSNVYILQGLIVEMEPKYRWDAEGYYKNAIMSIGDKPFANYVYYLMGRFCERIKGEWNEAKEYYEKSVKANNYEYRAIYKLAMYHENNGNYDSAVDKYRFILNILQKKIRNNYLQQKEYEFYYKSSYNLGMICEKQGRNAEAIEVYNDIIDMLEGMMSKEKPNRLYEEIFGGNGGRYLECIKEKIFDPGVYRQLIRLYDSLGRSSEADNIRLKLQGMRG